MNEARQHIRDWLKTHGKTAKWLSLKVGKNRAYVANYLRGNGGEYGPIFVLHPIVDFPSWLIEEARILQKAAHADRNRRQWAGRRNELRDHDSYDPQPWPVTIANLMANRPIYLRAW